jgi:hypothetical protein
VSALEKQPESVEMTDIFLVTEEQMVLAGFTSLYKPLKIFEPDGKLRPGAIERIQHLHRRFMHDGWAEVQQRYAGLVPTEREFKLVDEHGDPNGEVEMRSVQQVGPLGVFCMLYGRPN